MTYEEYTQLENLLSKQNVYKVPCNLYKYAENKARKSSFQALLDIFNYGYVMGQRAERARRKGVLLMTKEERNAIIDDIIRMLKEMESRNNSKEVKA